MPIDQAHAKRMLDLAARAASRAAGNVEPNPLVGCVIERDSKVLGLGHHRRFGDIHAEVDALNNCRARGHSCVDALINAKVSRVVCARKDPNPAKGGGCDRLRISGIPVEFTDVSPAALALSAPFAKRITTGLPWVIVKWAQTIDGRAATRTGESKWISCDQSRSRVHRLRAQVDAVVTAIGTVIADDPTLTARGGWLRRKVARRVVIDPDLELPEGCNLLRTLNEAPLTLVCSDEALSQKPTVVSLMVARGIEVIALGSNGEIDVTEVMAHLCSAHDAMNVLVEAGPGLTGRLLESQLVDELRVYIAPMIMADDQAKPVARGRVVNMLSESQSFNLHRVKQVASDIELIYRR
jgi:diaminohydroxyphosphoribosylaminopyrimidine deaminase / 5-amino-6-(5-phosphoribosylamino)uracil reductase